MCKSSERHNPRRHVEWASNVDTYMDMFVDTLVYMCALDMWRFARSVGAFASELDVSVK